MGGFIWSKKIFKTQELLEKKGQCLNECSEGGWLEFEEAEEKPSEYSHV